MGNLGRRSGNLAGRWALSLLIPLFGCLKVEAQESQADLRPEIVVEGRIQEISIDPQHRLWVSTTLTKLYCQRTGYSAGTCSIIPIDLPSHNGQLICQKDAFLCAAKGVSVGIAFNRRLGAGFFGGEGFILQKLEGDGMAFVHAGGTILERDLAVGETLRLDTGCLVALESTVAYDIQMVPGIKTALFGGEGLFFAALTGPGKIWVQSLPFSRLASRIFAAAPQGGGKHKGEGSILGGLGDVLMGDR